MDEKSFFDRGVDFPASWQIPFETKLFREWNWWALQLEALFLIKKNALFGGAEWGGGGYPAARLPLPAPPLPRHRHRKVSEVEISIVFCGHKPWK